MEPAAEGGTGDWGEVVTRYPYRKVGMDHLLSKELLKGSNLFKDFAWVFLFSFEGSNLQFCPLKTR